MTLDDVREGDIVDVDVKGRRALCFAGDRDGARLRVQALPGQAPFTWERVNATQVVGHWARKHGRRPR